MSSFAGRMKEYPTVSLDRFDRENLHARAYFLSHCHKDHMKGLKGPLLRRKLQSSRSVRLYCSSVTRELLLSNAKYAFWEDYTVPLELDSPTQISLEDEASGEKEDIVVTLLPAGHCPGSVMFLLEGCRGAVLYTGDFRLAHGDASRMEHLHSGSRVKDILSVYLDSTFYDPRFYQIPTREVCLSGISELVGNWIRQSSYHVVWLNCKAAYGYEYLFTNLGEEFNTQIHVNSLSMFTKMPEILSYVTTDRHTQIHACRHPKDDDFLQGNRLPCGCSAPDGTPLRIISIKPSTMWFGERTRKTSVIVKTGSSSYRACFSFHSSYSEIQDFLLYLQPVNIYPSVIPMGRSLTEVTHMLKLMCRKSSHQASPLYKPLGMLKRSRVQRPTLGCESDDELFEGLHVAPLRKKKGSIYSQQSDEVPEVSAPLESVEEFPPVTDSKKVSHNFVDCTESNGEEDDDDEEEDEEAREPLSTPSRTPKWEDFFTVDMQTNSQNSQSLSCCSAVSSAPSRLTGLQTPELFSEEEEESPHDFNLTLSAHSSQNLPDTLLLPAEEARLNRGDAGMQEVGPSEGGAETQERQSLSQGSSDFDIPPTPESKAPQQEVVLQLYRRLASGENIQALHR
ncbi:unnamed protein product [Ophioblennius macclurei]